MIWFNIEELEKQIVEDRFSDEEGFDYFLAVSILGALATYTGTSANYITYLGVFIGVLITIWGAKSIFKANSFGDGQDFFKRFFALSWVIGLRLLVIFLILALPLSLMFEIISIGSITSIESSSKSNGEELAIMIISSLFMLVYYYQLTNSFMRVSTKSN